MEPDTRVEFKRNKGFLWGLLAVSVCLVAAGVGMTLIPVDPAKDPVLLRVCGATLAGALGVVSIALVRMLLDPRPALTLDQQGMHDNSTAFPAGLVEWSDVTGFDVAGYGGKRRMLVVLVRDPAKYVERGGAVRRLFRRGDAQVVGSPITIGEQAVHADFDAMLERCIAFHGRFGTPDAVRRTSAST